MLKKNEQYCLTTFKQGRKCIFCGSYKVCKTKRGYVKCNKCGKQKGRQILKHELDTLVGFHQQIPALRLSKDLGVNYNTVKRVYNKKENKKRKCLLYGFV